jgi:DNA-binding NarL/FixJ family response regulator
MSDIPNRTTLLLAGFHPLILEDSRLQSSDDHDIHTVTADESTLLPAVDRVKPDVVLLDLLHTSSLKTIQRIRDIRPACPIVALSGMRRTHVAEAITDAIFTAGGSGILYRFTAAAELSAAVQAVLSGRQYLSPAFMQTANGRAGMPLRPSGQLSVLDELVFRLMAQHYPAHRIARVLGLSVGTIRLSMAYLKRQFRRHTNHDLRRYAMARHLVSSSP